MTDRMIKIEYPLDLSVAGALTRAIGAMWPAAMIDTTITDRLAIKVPDAPAAKITKKALRQMVEDEPDPDNRAAAEKFDGKTLTTTVPKDIARLLAQWAHDFLVSVEGAVNYVEQTAYHQESGKKLVVIACWSKDQTPHELRLKAEADRDEYRRKYEAYRDNENSLLRVTEAERDDLARIAGVHKAEADRMRDAHEKLLTQLESVAAAEKDRLRAALGDDGRLHPAAERAAQLHRVHEVLTPGYIGCRCGVGPLSFLSHAAHVAYATIGEFRAALAGDDGGDHHAG